MALRRKKRRRYRDDYKINPNAKRGSPEEVIYTGEYYWFDLSAGAFRKLKVIYGILASALALLFLAAGLINSGGTRQLYIALPYVAMLLPIGLALSDVYKIITFKGKMTYKQYNGSVAQLKRCTVSIFVLAIISTIGTGIYLIMNKGRTDIVREVKFLAALVAAALISGGFTRLQSQNKCKTDKERIQD